MVGKLNFAGKFVPDFKQRVKPIINLLGSKRAHRYTEPADGAGVQASVARVV